MEGEDVNIQVLLVLHHEDQRLRRTDLAAAAAGGGKERGWCQYCVATPSDVAVEAYRSWLDMAVRCAMLAWTKCDLSFNASILSLWDL